MSHQKFLLTPIIGLLHTVTIMSNIINLFSRVLVSWMLLTEDSLNDD
jgi:hypothetical protein